MSWSGNKPGNRGLTPIISDYFTLEKRTGTLADTTKKYFCILLYGKDS